MITSQPTRLVLAAALCWGAVGLEAWGQNQGNPQQWKPEMFPAVKIVGTIRNVRPGFVEVNVDRMQIVFPKQPADLKAAPRLTDDSNLKAVRQTAAVDANTRVAVTALTNSDQLKQGQAVRFSGKIDDKGQVTAPVARVDLFVPEPTFKPLLTLGSTFAGFFADNAPKDSPFQAEGIVVSYVKGQMTVLVDDNRRITCQVAPTAEVHVAANDYTLAKDGDRLVLEGRLIKPGQVVAQSLDVTLTHLQPKTPAPAAVPPAATPPASAPTTPAP